MKTTSVQIKKNALAICQKNNAQVTALRENILDLLLKYQGVVKAYQLLADLQTTRENVAPPTVYRALDFWVEQGVLHKVQALNGYVLCQHNNQIQHQGIILLCENCQQIFEVCNTPKMSELEIELSQKGFKIDMSQLVFKGICQICQNKK